MTDQRRVSGVDTQTWEREKKELRRLALIGALAVGVLVVGASVHAGITNSCSTPCVNVQEGDNSSRSDQEASAESGDAIAGQVVQVVSGGEIAVNASNATVRADLDTGQAEATNDSAQFAGLDQSTTTTVSTAAIDSVTATNVQEGDNDLDNDQEASAVSGDGVSGQALGLVGGGNVSVNANNSSINSDIKTGKATAANDGAFFVGLHAGDTLALTAGISNVSSTNIQEGENTGRTSTTADASSGDALSGQVLGVITGQALVSATLDNVSVDVDAATGGTNASSNSTSSFVGLSVSTTVAVTG